MRVYRQSQKRAILQNRSLTIREGISPAFGYCAALPVFPHYTWGYIICQIADSIRADVPSLYVRVYRVCDKWPQAVTRSLTIREGISSYVHWLVLTNEFPHYTWGYIGLKKIKEIQVKVPSLYVRVYRRNKVKFFSLVKFPHYTWGYIVLYMAQLCNNIVPSLYVRVYRKGFEGKLYEASSLTIREGISQMFSAMERQALFPHYTWGYIADFCGKIWSMLRSLTIREGISMSTI